MSDNNENKKSHGFLKFIITVIVLGVLIFGVVKIIQYQQSNVTIDGQGTSQGNSDGNNKLFERSANNSDIIIDSDLDLASLGGKYVVTPQNDIKNLQITINYLDNDKKILTSIVKNLGNVKKGVQVEFSISLFDLGLSVAWNTKYESIAVTGGTVSYIS